MAGPDLEAQARRLASLAEPVRLDLYRFVCAQHEPVGRDAAAQAVGIGRSLAAHHLDRLADDGLLEVEYRRLTGRTGPGAGRPAKLYRRSAAQVTVTLPPRRYELAGRLLAQALDGGEQAGQDDELCTAAREYGETLGSGAAEAGDDALAVLVAQGYEPEVEDGDVVLRNCPFDALVADHRDLVCGMNLALLEGWVEGLGPDATAWVPRLDPGEGHCCVRLTARRPD
ncbi:MAG: helix-turn-helix transcriptional regulator [Actinomycetes bacterium]